MESAPNVYNLILDIKLDLFNGTQNGNQYIISKSINHRILTEASHKLSHVSR